MKPGHLLVTGMIAGLCATAARAAIYPYAEYHLGEAGSLSGTQKTPQDSSGAGRHFLSAGSYGQDASISSAVSPAAIGSTASLNTVVYPWDPSWTGGGLSFSSLPKNNFAFGIFARTAGAAYGSSPVFSLGDNDGAFAIWLNDSKWELRTYHASAGNPGLAGNFVANTWAHLAVIRNGGVTRFYVNGVDQGSPSTYIPVHGGPLLGKNFTGETYQPPFDGLLDEARVLTFTEGETDANILAALQTGAPPANFVNTGNTATFAKANLAPMEPSVFRLANGEIKDFVRILDSGGFSVAGTAPEKHVIQMAISGPVSLGRYPLIGYTGSIGGQGFAGLQLGSLPAGVTAELENNAATSTIDLVITGTPGLTWTGSNSNVWDLNTTPNWVLDGSSTAAPFLNGWQVSFDDSTAATVNTVAIAETVSPTVIDVNASEDYSFSGAGIGGNAALVKRGTGTLTLTNANPDIGKVTASGGILKMGDGGTNGSIGSGEIALSGGQFAIDRSGGDFSLTNRLTGSGGLGKLGTGRLLLGSPSVTNAFTGPVTLTAGEIVQTRASLFTGASVTVAAGATLDLAGFSPGGSVTINGGGMNGQGALKNSGATMSTGLTLGSDASIGGGFRWYTNPPFAPDIPETRTSLSSSDFKLSKVGSGSLSFTRTDIRLKDFAIEGGTVFLDESTVVHNNYSGKFTISGGAKVYMNTTAFISATYIKAVISKPMVMNDGELAASGGPYGAFSVAAPIELIGSPNVFRAELHPSYVTGLGPPLPPATLTLSGAISGSGGLVMKGYGTVLLTQAPAYTGDTEVVGADGVITFHRGSLSLSKSGLDDASTVRIGLKRYLGLGFSGTDTVRRLFIGGVQQQPGVYGSGHISGSIGGSGTLTVTEGPSAPPYQLWETENGITGAGVNADSDGDGISNGIEFVIGGDPSGPGSDSSALLPKITQDGTNLIFVYRRADASSANYAMQVQTSITPASGWMSAESSYPVLNVLEENDAFGPGVDRVTVTIPTAGKPKLFARLLVTFP